ncbi:DNA-directed RNA polymerase III subunit C11 [Novymonas esmeraldas]|uniref:DNA-directed RNA polymerase III subunit C11 n=1 Tax=Novymonas esmeraldas TaxID=1808958 RepID=A0AAW0EPM0_9TRYP
MFFCPFCSTLLLVVPHVNGNAFMCATCRYVHSVASASGRVTTNAFGEPILTIQHSFVADNRPLMDAEEDPVSEAAVATTATSVSTSAAVAPAGGAAAAPSSSLAAAKAESATAEGGQVMTIRCQNDDSPCESTKAYYIQIQMRSADEPATVFFKCVQCGHQWRQD